MAAKLKENRALRDMCLRQLTETYDVGQAAVEETSLRPLFERRFQRVEQIADRFNQLHDTVIAAMSSQQEPDFDAEDRIRSQFDEYFYDIDEKYSRWFRTRHVPKPEPNQENHLIQGIRLPEMPLRQFNGDFQQWVPFIQSFDSAIHKNDKLTPFTKFQYLVSCLSGEPLNLIKSLPLTESNYPIAYNQLKDRYDDERKLASQYWSTIRSLPSLQTESVKGLRSLLDTFKECRAALQALQIADNLEDFLWFNLLLDKLDSQTRRLFESGCRGDKSIPNFTKLESFVESQCRVLESLGKESHRTSSSKADRSHGSKVALVAKTSSETNTKCPICQATSHIIYSCSTFKSLNPTERHARVKGLRLCYNCLKSSHSASKCPSKQTCKECGSSHHSLLHLGNSANRTLVEPPGETPPPPEPTALCARISRPLQTAILLATVSLQVLDKWGIFHTARALLDPGSQASFMVNHLAKQLGLNRSRQMVTPILGLGNKTSESFGSVTAIVCPSDVTTSSLRVEFIVLDRICNNLPSTSVDNNLPHIRSVKLADPNWYRSKPIDILLGADTYPSIAQNGLISGDSQQPIAINTIFGWAIIGPVSASNSSVQSLVTSLDSPLDMVLHKFWELEEPPCLGKPLRSQSEDQAESLFLDTVFREPSGRFGVALPFKGPLPTFEESRLIADKRWLNMERRLETQPLVKGLYSEFMRDYVETGHMSLRTAPVPEERSYYIPHHGVLKDCGDTQKIRVVFDASARDAKGQSLNDTQLPGPRLQADIVQLLIRFRAQPVAFTCDIKQMYRQILVAPEHQLFQLIRYRFSPKDPIQTYQLHTVTYGVSSSPYLAIRTLLYLADQHRKEFPLAAEALGSSLYVDDLVCGANSLEAAHKLKTEVIELLKLGCFELRKWATNKEDLLEDIPESHRQSVVTSFDKDMDSSVKVLGLEWESSSDVLQFDVQAHERPCTKRAILSEIARIYDPLGLLSPVSFTAKCLIQQLWSAGIGWDETPPTEILETWTTYRNGLSQLSRIKIPRLVLSWGSVQVQLHAFCDASQKGYACALYIRYIEDGVPHCRLLLARSKVAPLKTISIPRLELCGAVLLAKMTNFALETLQKLIKIEHVIAWCDSTVALTWIKSPSSRWKVFVANRVSQIHEVLPPSHWRHVGTKDNPADLPTRGVPPSVLVSSSLWWSGPLWLSLSEENWPVQPQSFVQDIGAAKQEERVTVLVAQSQPKHCLEELLNRRSSLKIVLHAIVRCRHAFRKIRDSPPITREEATEALYVLVKYTQEQHFAQEIQDVRAERLPRRPFRTLSLFLDERGLLRVGGRLIHSELCYDAKHPLLLPTNSRLTTLIIEDCHKEHCHPGLNTLHSLLRQNFWILAPRKAIRRCLDRCRPCWRVRPRCSTPLMGNLPKMRISEIRAFKRVGVDYGGPLLVTMSRHRGAKTSKAWICLFVCFSTKAIHLELASELSTDSFIAALRRFVARRGRPSDVHSDCGTNFVGAVRQMNEVMRAAVTGEGIAWHFNPPAAPHFGGLWEAGIKSVKTHLHRVIGNQIFCYEELYTFLTQIEALLNSRPLSPLSADPNDLSVLTPGHFLTLEPLGTLPSPNDTEPPRNRLKRWQLIQCLHRDFWRRWHLEYLHELQQRPKWQKPITPLTVGSLVLIKDELSPPMQWRLGRVLELFPGADNVARVASVKTKTGVFKRPITKLAPLPIED